MASTPGYRDTYFGDLALQAQNRGLSALHVGVVLQDSFAVLRSFRQRRSENDPAMMSLGRYVRPWDIPAAAWRALFPGLTVSNVGSWQRQIRTDLLADTGTRFDGLMMEKAWGRLLKDIRPKHCLQMWENNPWEKSLLIAAKQAGVSCDGYLHTVVIPAHLKFQLTDTARDYQPLPRKIFCAGPGSADRLRGLGVYPDGMVLPACMLRDTLPDSEPTQPEIPIKVRTILVVLEGLPTMVDLIRFADQAAAEFPDIDFQVRAHPALGLNRLGPMANVEFDKGRALSAPAMPAEIALQQADLVIYQGSMMGVTAMWLGVPVVKFQADPLLDDDPLPPDAGQFRVKDPVQLGQAIAGIESWSEESYMAWRDGARNAVLSVMTPQSPDHIDRLTRS